VISSVSVSAKLYVVPGSVSADTFSDDRFFQAIIGACTGEWTWGSIGSLAAIYSVAGIALISPLLVCVAGC